jgi:hypothetical protein
MCWSAVNIKQTIYTDETVLWLNEYIWIACWFIDSAQCRIKLGNMKDNI